MADVAATSKLKIGVLVSGSGSNLGAILERVENGTLDVEVVVVISNVASAGGLVRARAHGVPALVVSHQDWADRREFDRELVRLLQEHGATVVVLAGFMRIVTSELLSAFPRAVVNVHPALLPAFPGTHAQEKAFDYGVRIAGCTVHFVDEGTDTGPIIAQAVVPVLPNDTKESLGGRILVEEHKLLPTVLQWMAEGRVVVEEPVRAAGTDASLIETDEGGGVSRARVRVQGSATSFGLP